jgi:hypothetical protein
MPSMALLKPVHLNFSPDDMALIEALRQKTGIKPRVDVIRLALRRLAVNERLEWPPPEKAKSA